MLDDHLKYPNALPKDYILGSYRIVQTLTEDNVSLTYLALTPQQEKVVIVEYLPKHLSLRNRTNNSVILKGPNCKYEYEWGLSQYHQEISDLIQLKHPHVNPIQTCISTNNTLYKISRYIKGNNLKTYTQNRRLTENEIMFLFAPLLDGLKSIHQAGYLHSDLNPYNIVIEKTTEKPIIINLATAKYLFSGHKNSLPLPPTNYVAYEQFQETEKQGIGTDLYAIGAILYEITTGNIPVSSIIRMNTIRTYSTNAPMNATVNDPLPPASFIAKNNYSEHFLNAIDHAIQLAITERPQHINVWIKELGIIQKRFIEDEILACSITQIQQENGITQPIKKELTIAGLSTANTDTIREAGPAYMDFETISRPLSISEKLVSNNKRYTAIILLITLIAIIAGSAFYYLQLSNTDSHARHIMTNLFNQQS